MESDENPNRAIFIAFIRIVPFIIGLLIIGIGIIFSISSAKFLKNSSTIVGVITSYEKVLRVDRTEEIQKNQKPMYKATVSYIVNNEEYNISPSTYTRSVPTIGKKIKVYHLIEDPWEAKLTFELFLFPLIPVVLGVLIISINLMLYIKKKSSS